MPEVLLPEAMQKAVLVVGAGKTIASEKRFLKSDLHVVRGKYYDLSRFQEKVETSTSMEVLFMLDHVVQPC